MRNLLLLVCLGSVSVGCGAARESTRRGPGLEAQRQVDFGDVDRNASDDLDDEEFFRVAGTFYDEWDSDQDGRLSDDELVVGMFDAWDKNRSGRLDHGEIVDGVQTWLPEDEQPTFDAWDQNDDMIVDAAELRDGLADARLFESYDSNGDGTLTDLEFSGALFSYWDIDGDSAIDAFEWRFD